MSDSNKGNWATATATQKEAVNEAWRRAAQWGQCIHDTKGSYIPAPNAIPPPPPNKKFRGEESAANAVL